MAGPDVADTDPDARRLQFDLWRAMEPVERLRLADGISRDVEKMARVGIARQHPDATPREVLWHLASRRYGSGVANAAFGSIDA